MLNPPSPDCPNSGVCITMLGRIDDADRELERHTKALERIGAGLDQQGKDLHEIRIMFRERDGTMNFIRNVFLGLLAVGILQVGSTIWFAASLNTTVVWNTSIINDHELRLRSGERLDVFKTNP